MPTAKPIHIDFYDTLKQQNDTLKNSVNNMEELYSTDTNKFKYKYTELKNMKFIATVCFYIYYVILFFLAIILYFTPKLHWTIKILLCIIFLGYPFYIYFIENILYQALSYISANT